MNHEKQYLGSSSATNRPRQLHHEPRVKANHSSWRARSVGGLVRTLRVRRAHAHLTATLRRGSGSGLATGLSGSGQRIGRCRMSNYSLAQRNLRALSRTISADVCTGARHTYRSQQLTDFPQYICRTTYARRRLEILPILHSLITPVLHNLATRLTLPSPHQHKLQPPPDLTDHGLLKKH